MMDGIAAADYFAAGNRTFFQDVDGNVLALMSGARHAREPVRDPGDPIER